MATGYRCKIRPVHADGYVATCSCGAKLERQGIRAVLEENRHTHLRKHAMEVC